MDGGGRVGVLNGVVAGELGLELDRDLGEVGVDAV